MAKRNSVRVLLADDHVLVRRGLKVLLEQAPGFSVVGEVGNGQDAVDFCGQFDVDVVLMDIDMPICSGIEATEAIKETRPDVSVIILSATCHDSDVYDAIKAGASGYLQKDLEPDELFQAINDAAQRRKEPLLGGSISAKLFRELERRRKTERAKQRGEALSERERDVFDLIKIGLTNQEISNQLSISLSTTKNHVSSIMRKLGLRNRVEIATYALDVEEAD